MCVQTLGIPVGNYGGSLLAESFFVWSQYLTKHFRLLGKHCHLGVLLGPSLGAGIVAESAGAVGYNCVGSEMLQHFKGYLVGELNG